MTPGARTGSDKGGVGPPQLLLHIVDLHRGEHIRPVVAADGEDLVAKGHR